MKPGQAHYSALLYEHGGFVDDILVHKVADDHYFMCVNASNQDKDYEHIVDTINLMPKWIASALRSDCDSRSPGARNPAKADTGRLGAIRYYHFTDGTFRARRRASRAPDIPARTVLKFTLPRLKLRASGTNYCEAGEEFGIKPCGLGARNTLRLESKMALYGHEIHASITPWKRIWHGS